MKKNTKKTIQQLSRLVQIVEKLRGPNGCPWDRQQTQKSLTQYAIEEAFELADAIEQNDQKSITEELGDFLFQVILQAQVAEDMGLFNLNDVVCHLNEKMIRRHPHVFAKSSKEMQSNPKIRSNRKTNLEEVWKNWEKQKRKEKAAKKDNSVFNFPKALPALQTAHKIGVKTARFKFDWTAPEQVFEKVKEEVKELNLALKNKNPNELEHEIGDVLFSVAQLARHVNLEPEQCLRIANSRFEKRFSKVLKLSGVNLDKFIKLPTSKKEKLWRQIKKME